MTVSVRRRNQVILHCHIASVGFPLPHVEQESSRLLPGLALNAYWAPQKKLYYPTSRHPQLLEDVKVSPEVYGHEMPPPVAQLGCHQIGSSPTPMSISTNNPLYDGHKHHNVFDLVSARGNSASENTFQAEDVFHATVEMCLHYPKPHYFLHQFPLSCIN